MQCIDLDALNIRNFGSVFRDAIPENAATMRTNILFEFEDLHWFPNSIRESMTDYLRYLLTGLNFYQPIYPLLLEMLDKTKTNQIVDLCSGGGGAIEQVKRNLDKISGRNIRVTLTDKFPNFSAFTWIERHSSQQITFSNLPVDATDVPSQIKGVRTIFSGFHHFDPLHSFLYHLGWDCLNYPVV